MSFVTVEQVRTSFASPVSVKCTNQETTSTKGKFSLSHEMQSYICSGVERDHSESEAGSIGVDQGSKLSILVIMDLHKLSVHT